MMKSTYFISAPIPVAETDYHLSASCRRPSVRM
jgi:hypothetical protein